jgi:glycosyltransferase involved in cell wall biosynthesis
LLFRPRDAQAIAATVLELVQRPEQRRRLALEAAAEVRTRWLWPRVLERMRRVYAELIPERRAVVVA